MVGEAMLFRQRTMLDLIQLVTFTCSPTKHYVDKNISAVSLIKKENMEPIHFRVRLQACKGLTGNN